MKIKAIEKILKQSKRIIIIHEKTGEWLSDGRAYYPIENIELNADTVCTIFDIAGDDVFKYSIFVHEHSDTINLSDCDDGEEMLGEKSGISIIHGGEVYSVYEINGLAVYLPARYLKPYKDMDIQLYARYVGSKMYIVAKAGMFIAGAFVPYDIINAEFTDMLSKIHHTTQNSYEFIKAMKEDVENEQDRFRD